MLWIKDVIKTENGVHYIPSNYRELMEKGEQYETIWSLDSQAERLRKEWDSGSGWIEAPICVSVGDAGCSFLEPFISKQEALDWIREQVGKERVYFSWNANQELREMFPEIPILSQEHWKALGS